MRRVFILLNLSVVAVLLGAWFIYGLVWAHQSRAQEVRVVLEAHGGGARIVASELDSAPIESREQKLQVLRSHLRFQVEILQLADLPSSLRRRFAAGEDVACWIADDGEPRVIVVLSSQNEVVSLGPFQDYTLREIESSIRGWVRLTARRIDESTLEERPQTLLEIRNQFELPVSIEKRNELPEGPLGRIETGTNTVFYQDTLGKEPGWFAARTLADESEVLRFGPFPEFEEIERNAATTTLGFVLIPAAIIIAILLFPIARQLRRIEGVAMRFANGDLSARVDVRRIGAAKQLAIAFNKMASRGDLLVRTQRELFQAVSHELRTPLSRIRFAIDLIDEAKSDEELSKRLESLDAASEELDRLVGELLVYVKMESDDPNPAREIFPAQEAVEGLLPKYSELYPSIDCKIAENGETNETRVFANPNNLERVMNNLISNAFQHAESAISISFHSSKGMTIIDVDDDGPGIQVSERDRMLEPFVRGEKDTPSGGSGVGLGLAIANRIMTHHGGKIEVMESPYGGCRMRTAWLNSRKSSARKST